MDAECAGWISANESVTKRELKLAGYSSQKQGDTSKLDVILSRLVKEHDVAFAGPLAGYDSGLHDILGSRVLVTESPKLVQAKQGEFPTVRAVVEGLLGDDVQLDHFYGWLKMALDSLYGKKRQHGQCLVVAGPKDCGKSLLQKIITQLFGGREARPYQFMRGGSEFNGDLFGAEHLVIEDEQPSNDHKARRNMGARIKELTVNQAQRCHKKFQQALSLTPFWRVSISVNDEPENLARSADDG